MQFGEGLLDHSRQTLLTLRHSKYWNFLTDFLDGRVFLFAFSSEQDAASMTQMPGFAVVLMNGAAAATYYACKVTPEKFASRVIAPACGPQPFAVTSFWGLSVLKGQQGGFVL